MKKIAIIGAGPSGLTCARHFAEAGFKVQIFEKKNHLAGNCYDEKDSNEVLVHKYGPHYFRTNSKSLLEWLSQFTDWIPGDYFVKAKINSKSSRLRSIYQDNNSA